MNLTACRRLLTGVAVLSLATTTTAQSDKAPRYGAFGIDITAENTTVKPGDDFWTYANGTWDKRTAIAADRASAGYGVILSDEAEANVRTILNDMAANPAQFGAAGRQVGDLYASWMDAPGIEARGTAPLRPYLGRIAGVTTLADLQVLFATTGYASPVEIGVIPSLADPNRYTAVTGQGSLGMPRDYFLLPGDKYDAFRRAYRAYVQQIQELAGIPDAAAKPTASSRSKRRWPRRNGRPSRAATSPSSTIPKRWRGSRRRLPSSTGRCS